MKLPAYRLPQAYCDTVQQNLQEMLATGFIEPSKSEWASPIVLVKKKDGSLRLCVDYRRLNARTTVDAYPMPRIDDLLDRLGQARFLTMLDLAWGYWQVPMAGEDQSKTAFTTHMDLFQFRVMPLGLSGAPATFQRMMDSLVCGLEPFAAVYLNDLVIRSQSWMDHLQHIRYVL